MSNASRNKKRRILTGKVGLPATSFVLSSITRTLMSCIETRFVVEDIAAVPHKRNTPGIYVFWHEMLLLPARHCSIFTTLVSSSSDGDLTAATLRRLGGKVLRGSTSRGRLNAMREICRPANHEHISIAADGPRGPAREIPVGIVRAAGATGKPIVPVGMAMKTCFRLGPRNMKIVFPWLFSKAWMVIGRPINVPEVSSEDKHLYRDKVQAAMDATQLRAERLLKGDEHAESLSLSRILAL